MKTPPIRRALAASALLLAACGNISATSPSTCPTDEILPTMNDYVEGSVFIDTQWEPFPNTDLAAALDAGGVACSYGIQEAEVGATILWAPGKDTFAVRRAQWQADGLQRVTVDGADEAWALLESTGVEQHLWQVNLLVDDVWVQVNATFLRDFTAATPLIDAALAVTR